MTVVMCGSCGRPVKLPGKRLVSDEWAKKSDELEAQGAAMREALEHVASEGMPRLGLDTDANEVVVYIGSIARGALVPRLLVAERSAVPRLLAERKRQAAEIGRLRTIEAAAREVSTKWARGDDVTEDDWDALALSAALGEEEPE